MPKSGCCPITTSSHPPTFSQGPFCFGAKLGVHDVNPPYTLIIWKWKLEVDNFPSKNKVDRPYILCCSLGELRAERLVPTSMGSTAPHDIHPATWIYRTNREMEKRTQRKQPRRLQTKQPTNNQQRDQEITKKVNANKHSNISRLQVIRLWLGTSWRTSKIIA